MTRTHLASPRVKLSVFACALLAFGLLLWARFILVTGHPRTAIAEPSEQKQFGAAPADATPNH